MSFMYEWGTSDGTLTLCAVVAKVRLAQQPSVHHTCWNSHRLTEQSSNRSITASIGGIQTEVILWRGREILTRALCSGGLEDAFTEALNTSCGFKYHTAEEGRRLADACVQIYHAFSACQATGRRSLGFHETRASRFRSCLLESEQSASSLSQSEGIQSASAAEYKVGCRRVSSHSTDTVDSSA